MIVPSAAVTTDLLDRLRFRARRAGNAHDARLLDVIAQAHRQRTVATSTAFTLLLAVLDHPIEPPRPLAIRQG